MAWPFWQYDSDNTLLAFRKLHASTKCSRNIEHGSMCDMTASLKAPSLFSFLPLAVMVPVRLLPSVCDQKSHAVRLTTICSQSNCGGVIKSNPNHRMIDTTTAKPKDGRNPFKNKGPMFHVWGGQWVKKVWAARNVPISWQRVRHSAGSWGKEGMPRDWQKVLTSLRIATCRWSFARPFLRCVSPVASPQGQGA